MKSNPESIAEWMDRHKLTVAAIAFAIKYSPGIVYKWRQNVRYPSARALKPILRRWPDFPERP